MSTKKRLGRGLEALIPQNMYSSDINTIETVAINKIKVNQYQPRYKFDEKALESLSASIKQHGLAQPVLVRKKDDLYELVAGERRLKACLLADMTDIQVIVKDVSDKESMQLALIENMEREDLNPIEVAKGYDRMINEFQMTHDEISKLFTKSRSSITNSLRLLKLPKAIQEYLENNVITEGHAKAILSCSTPEDMMKICESIIKGKMNVRDTETKVKQKKTPQSATLKELNMRFTQKLKLKTAISGNETKGKLSIQYNSEEELAALQKLLG